MWAGCIWVPIYEVMTRKHLKLVTLEENLEMAADIGMDATTSLDEAFAEAMERHGPDAKVIVLPVRALPAAAQHGADGRGAAALPAGGARALTQSSIRGIGAARGADAAASPPDEIRGSTTIVELLRMFPDGEAARLMGRSRMPVRALRRGVPRAADDGREAARAIRAPCSKRSARSTTGGPTVRAVDAARRRAA